MNQPANQAQVLPILWSSLTMAQVLITGMGFFLASQQGVTPTFAVDRLLPGDGPGAILFGLSFVAAVAAVVVPPKVAAALPKDDTRSDVARAYTPFILHLAMAESATLMGFVGATFMTQPPVPERIVLPAIAGLLAALLGFPTAARLRALAGSR